MTSQTALARTSVGPWLVGAFAAFLVRMACSFSGMNGHNADAVAMYLFLGLSLLILTFGASVPMLRMATGSGREVLAHRVLPLAAITVTAGMTWVFGFQVVRDF